MRMYVVAAMLTSELAIAAPVRTSTLPPLPAPAPSAAQTAQPDAPVIAENWTAPAPADKSLVRRAIKQSFEDEKEIAIAESKAKAIPRRYTASSYQEIEKYEKFGQEFAEAKVPGCLKPDGLKRQPTFFLGGLLAIPFIAVAAIRGKCN